MFKIGSILLVIFCFSTSLHANSITYPCNSPTGFDIIRTSPSSASIYVDHPNYVYDIFIAVNGSAGANPNSNPTPGPNNDISGFPQTRNNLNPNYVYDVWIRRQCANSTSEWVGPVHVPLFQDQEICVNPTGFNAIRLSATSAMIEVDEPNETYDLFVSVNGLPGANPNSNPTPGNYNISNFPITRNNLAPNSYYDVWIRKVCSDNHSEWIGPIRIPIFAPTPPCNIPTELHGIRISETTAELSSYNLNNIYDLYVVISGEPGPEENREPNHRNYFNIRFPYILEGLNQNRAYDVYIRQNCGESQSNWSGPLYIPIYLANCPPPSLHELTIDRIDEYNVIFSGFDPAYYYEGSISRVGERFSQTPNYDMLRMRMPYTLNRLEPLEIYHIWFRTDCRNGKHSPWVGPSLISPFQSRMNLTITPNPAQNKVSIGSSKFTRFKILNMTGTLQFEYQLRNNEINIENLSPGQYIIQAQDHKGQVSSSRFIKK
ncbi:T9SS type A sorting domain-containing protein [Weeksellaceae bacterium KMM 9713]|uniref:T9SS type A sorting domain-containing protein n=1 Tax=Profundicola chukchiensis TaxID=2961959 RepID=A0A9X4RTP4_9FLAO|nr:T9SS type A sorting domain-containing protein [Profundicola chukchiensis]MDG4944806.1 T9SS type A sorting domain-containing protein [Profundicola chukchiensis]